MDGLACCDDNVKDIDASELERLGPIAQMFPSPTVVLFCQNLFDAFDSGSWPLSLHVSL